MEQWRVFMWTWRHFRLSLITRRKGNSLHNFGLIFHLGHILTDANCRLELFSSWPEVFVKWRSSQKSRFSTELMKIGTIRSVCLPLTEIPSMFQTEIQRTNPFNRNKTNCTCWQHALIIQLFTKYLFTFLDDEDAGQTQISIFFFPDEIDLWNYLLFLMSCLFFEQMCIG